MNFFKAIQLCIKNNLIFAAYRLPNTDSINLVVQKSNVPKKVKITAGLFNNAGFLVSPFNENESNQSYLISSDLVYTSTDYADFDELKTIDAIPCTDECFENGIISRKDFINQVNEIIKAISEKKFEKAVLSRIKIVERNYRSKLTEIFQMLSSSYPNAFVYLFNVAGQTWMGATPEPLVCSHQNELETVSLAGTREYTTDNLNLRNWSTKEIVEQDLVTRYIENILSSLKISYLKKRGPYTKKAGNLIHLRTDFTLDFSQVNGHIDKLIRQLHPTSAVCGYPKKESMEFILHLEKHNRKYYSGFMGPVNIDEKVLLFVNLRCMQVLCDKLVLHIGAGITIDSVPEDEWDETEIKADTLLSVIHKV
jgi:isochorismate synthase